MNGMIYILIWALVAIGVSFLCSVIEAVMLSITDAQVASITKTKPRLGSIWEEYKDDIDTPLFGVLALNTISHTAGAGGVGAATLETYGDGYVAIASAILTVMILIFSELIPKTIGNKYAKQLAGPTAHVVFVINLLTYPLTRPITLVKTLFIPESENDTVDKEELTGFISFAGDRGIIQEETETILNNVLNYSEMKISEIMTPIEIVESISTSEAHIHHKLSRGRAWSFSKIPINDTKNHYIHKYSLQQPAETRNLVETSTVNGEVPAMDLHHYLRNNDLIFVSDNNGKRIGIVCREDLLDCLLATPVGG
jgi:CBS domain containing-hemolysin-like protein